MPTVIPPFEKMTGVATSLGWTCLTQEWTGYHSRYPFECSRGHRFERSVAQILYLRVPGGCPECWRENLRERWHAVIKQRGSMAISGEFKNVQTRHRLKSAEGHEWETRAGRIFEGTWCPSAPEFPRQGARCGRTDCKALVIWHKG